MASINNTIKIKPFQNDGALGKRVKSDESTLDLFYSKLLFSFQLKYTILRLLMLHRVKRANVKYLNMSQIKVIYFFNSWVHNSFLFI